MHLSDKQKVFIRQKRELAELFGFETRNKYEIFDEGQNLIGYAAEQNKGVLGFLFRQFLGHWRSFQIFFFDPSKNLVFKTDHPFRFFFQEFTVLDQHHQKLGRIQQRFGILTKKFDIHDEHDQVVFTMRSGFFSIWSFPIQFANSTGEAALIAKKWSGLFKEIFLDTDNFLLEFKSSSLNEKQKKLFLAASLFVDLQYFERKAD